MIGISYSTITYKPFYFQARCASALQPFPLQKLWGRTSLLLPQGARNPSYVSAVQQHPNTHTCLTALCPGKVKPIWILLKQETASGSGISWDICKSAPRSRQITTPVPHHSVFTGRMPFLPRNQQRQSTEGNIQQHPYHNYKTYLNLTSTQILQHGLFEAKMPDG